MVASRESSLQSHSTKGKSVNIFQKWLSLSKLSLSSLVVLTTLMGMLLAPGSFSWLDAFFTILGTTLIVASANTFNCIIERESDKLMSRTAKRPLPMGQMSVQSALAFGIVTGVLAIYLLFHYSNGLTASLGLIGFISYVALYTPLKRYSMAALFVGAIPGAIPPMMGWAFVTEDLGLVAWILFWILFFWQLPHFIAISIFRADDYARAGLKTLPQALGIKKARYHMLLYAAVLSLVSISPIAFGAAGGLYTLCALILGFVFISLCVAALQDFEILRRTRLVFFATLVYLPVLLGLWLCDSFLRSATG